MQQTNEVVGGQDFRRLQRDPNRFEAWQMAVPRRYTPALGQNVPFSVSRGLEWNPGAHPRSSETFEVPPRGCDGRAAAAAEKATGGAGLHPLFKAGSGQYEWLPRDTTVQYARDAARDHYFGLDAAT